jgi:CxxC motif-containing protein (DUF1111 family)
MSKNRPVFHMSLCAAALLCAVSLQAQTNSTATQSSGRFTVPNQSTSTSTSSAATTSGSTTGAKSSIPGATDPGPRPTGNTSRTLTGAKLQNQIPNGLQPKDPDLTSNNDGAGQVIANGGPTAGFWFQALTVFGQEATPNGASNGNGINTIAGLGPAFNGNSCFVCHSQPTIGGSSPAVNPQVALATLDGATNTVPSFVTLNGPIQEARFILDLAHDPSGSTLDGGVHELFTIQGRTDAPAGCTVSQPDFATELGRHNLITRLPIPTFGEGFIENVTEAALQANLAANAATKNNLGIFGRFNTNGNDGTITRFGWKAQNKSLLLFSGEAANVELGVTNELFTNEKVAGTNCAGATPEDNTAVLVPTAFPVGGTLNGAQSATEISSDIENFAFFMRFNASPSQCDFASGLNTAGGAVCNPLGSDALAGKALFGTSANPGIGCVLCHTDTLTTGPATVPKFNNQTFHPFSDFALHHMGSVLTDGVTQGLAGPDEFRTPPLWGLGQRLFFLHDGRCHDLVCAIEAHGSTTNNCTRVITDAQSFIVNGFLFQPGIQTTACGSEANIVVNNFNALTTAQAQQLLDYLRSL